jgi:hypothetical protein
MVIGLGQGLKWGNSNELYLFDWFDWFKGSMFWVQGFRV